MRTLIYGISAGSIGFLLGMYVVMVGLSPRHLFIASASYAAQAYNLGCLKHEMFDVELCHNEAMDYFNKHIQIFGK